MEPGRPEQEILALQNAAGNKAVSQLLQAQVQQPERNRKQSLFSQLREAYFQDKQQEAIEMVQKNKNSGSSLPLRIQATLGEHYGADLSGVRIHQDQFANQSARSLDANAFTVRQDIFFGQDMYAPNQINGMLRLAHEIAHTIQQRGTSTPSSAQIQTAERQAENSLPGTDTQGNSLSSIGPAILREPTYPRRTTGDRMIAEVERILTTTRDRTSADETTRLWSSVGSNFSGPITTGSIARRVWTHIFLRHFVEPDSRPGVESAHPRYFYSQTYGWVDAQHFFGFIDFAEQQYQRSGGDRQRAFDDVTRQGREIEEHQQQIRDYITLGRPPATGPLRHMQVRPPNTPLFRVPQMAAEGGARTIAGVVLPFLLSGTQGEVYGLLNQQRRQKFLTDSAKSAFTYEDFQSNQLGTRFFFQHGVRINGLDAPFRENAFRNALISFFRSVRVENDQQALDRLAAHLPGRETFEAPKTTEETVRAGHPDLFQLPTP